MKHTPALLAAVFALLLAACSSMPDSPGASYTPPAMPTKLVNGALVDNDGMTLYTFDKDATPGKSACNDKCLFNWPAYFATPDDTAKGDYTIFERDDGMTQWAYKGKPLYYYEKDKKPGDRLGEAVANWKLAKP
ncbi:MAG: hypothetical protein REI09_06995 [Candidatus Dactylopiibacterium sp.]|nr:hypothetical protein [Candidatus Dactylopiibacterium sp.]